MPDLGVGGGGVALPAKDHGARKVISQRHISSDFPRLDFLTLLWTDGRANIWAARRTLGSCPPMQVLRRSGVNLTLRHRDF